MKKPQIFFSGIDGDTGRLVRPPIEVRSLVRKARRDAPSGYDEAYFDEGSLRDAGWGVIFPSDIDEAIVESLSPLLDFRENQAGELFLRIHFPVDRNGRPGWDKKAFLGQHDLALGESVDPERLPYHLLIVASPEQIPFEFQYQLAVQYAVGRLHFDGPDRIECYANYAANAVAAEAAERVADPRLMILGTQHDDDEATGVSISSLVDPLGEKLARARIRRRSAATWTVESLGADQSRKNPLLNRLGGKEKPELLFTAGHGLSYGLESEKQRPLQGALVCQDWPGPGWEGPFSDDFFIGARDIEDDADLRGLISFHFACFSAGTTEYDSFAQCEEPKPLAPGPFIASLPQRMLGHPKGSLAFIGHVDQACWHSFKWEPLDKQIGSFETLLVRLLEGEPVGHGMRAFGDRYAALTVEYYERRTFHSRGYRSDDDEYLRVALVDARSYLLLGDPAARIPVGKVDPP